MREGLYRQSLVSLVEKLPPESCVVEVGVHRGRSSALLFERFPSLFLYMVDPWKAWSTPHGTVTQKQQYDYRDEALSRTQFAADRRNIIRATSEEAARYVESADLVFIDGDHGYEACLLDCRVWWPKITSILCGHDYGKDDFPGVTQAVDEFAAENNLTINALEGNIWWIEKP